MTPVRITTLCIAFFCILLASCTSPSTTGLASARQQTLNISVSVKGDVPTGVPAVSITTGAMTYDGTRGDVAKNKAVEGGTISDDDAVQLPLQQASPGATIARSVLDRLKTMAAGDSTEAVPEGLDMSLEDWKLLVAAYRECPECLALTPAEEAALKKAVGKE